MRPALFFVFFVAESDYSFSTVPLCFLSMALPPMSAIALNTIMRTVRKSATAVLASIIILLSTVYQGFLPGFESLQMIRQTDARMTPATSWNAINCTTHIIHSSYSARRSGAFLNPPDLRNGSLPPGMTKGRMTPRITDRIVTGYILSANAP